MGDQQFALHSPIALVKPRRPGISPAQPINPTYRNIAVADQQYQKNTHDYNLVKNMNSALKKIVVAVIDKQWMKGAKYKVMGYTNESFVELKLGTTK